ncbi:MAG: hypothetical protein ABSC72_01420 [Methylovirgula sp.]|jgi:hypothetical protein
MIAAEILLAKPHREQGGDVMGLGRGMLLWLIGVPIPIIILIALFWHH